MSIEAFSQHTGVAAPFLQANIDTDAIIPSREMKLVSKIGLGEGLFAASRYTLPGGREPNPDFVLNKAEYANTSILLAGPNFGCGSSREHAVWALKEYGIRCIIAPGFGSIFYNNCIGNGLLPIKLGSEEIEQLYKSTLTNPQTHTLTVDLIGNTVTSCQGDTFGFEMASSAREMLIKGLDSIAATLQHNAQIDAFESRDRANRPWAYL